MLLVITDISLHKLKNSIKKGINQFRDKLFLNEKRCKELSFTDLLLTVLTMLYILMFTLKEEVLLLVGAKKTWKKIRFNYITNEQREIEKERSTTNWIKNIWNQHKI